MTRLLIFLATSLFSLSVYAQTNWSETLQQAKGQTVYFHAWGGSQEINNYMRWVSQQLKRRYNVTLKHVKVTDISETTTRLIAEKAAGQNTGGSADMVWINGENFKSMKDNKLLYGPFVETLPNWQFVDKSLPVESDFSEPTMGLEAPWGVGQLVFIYDELRLNNPPQSFSELLSYAKTFPNRVTYPQPPEFHGTSFLKALLIELTDNTRELAHPVSDADFEKVTAPLWQYLDDFHLSAWRSGQQFPTSSAQTMQLLDDNQIDLAITFNPNAVYSAQANGTLAKSTRAYAMQAGALTNVHFLAIPWNANAKAGALVAINFLMGSEAQSRKGNLNVWGDPSILETKYLTGSAHQTRLFKAIPEPHPSWQGALEAAWKTRYGQ
ncbi:ABC transporter substrate-binding protein [Vibrio olivae]|uniref:ABC transporter substrate-binding protein n=1 Tax=Vibrio olivae TaxID=1243002 RepID=A0ABV5HJF5_9VIBR